MKIFHRCTKLKSSIKTLLIIVCMLVVAFVFESNHYGIKTEVVDACTSTPTPIITKAPESNEQHIIIYPIPVSKPVKPTVLLSPDIQIDADAIEIPEDKIPSSEEVIDDPELLPIKETLELQEPEHPIYYIFDNGYRFDMPVEWQNYLWELLKQYGIEKHYALCIALIYCESKFEPNTVSSTNDYGLMQINVCNHNYLRTQLGTTNFLDPYENMDAGIFTLSYFLKKYDVQQALVCYNMGETRGKYFTESSYSREVISYLDCLHEIHEV